MGSLELGFGGFWRFWNVPNVFGDLYWKVAELLERFFHNSSPSQAWGWSGFQEGWKALRFQVGFLGSRWGSFHLKRGAGSGPGSAWGSNEGSGSRQREGSERRFHGRLRVVLGRRRTFQTKFVWLRFVKVACTMNYASKILVSLSGNQLTFFRHVMY